MRILQVGPIPPEVGGKTTGGVASHMWELSCHLAKRGHEVAIIADNFPDRCQFPVTKDGVKIYGLSASKEFILKQSHSVFLNLSTLIKLRRHFAGLVTTTQIIATLICYEYVLSHFKPNIVHVHHLELRFPYAHFILKDSTPIITTIHSFHTVNFPPSSFYDFQQTRFPFEIRRFKTFGFYLSLCTRCRLQNQGLTFYLY